MEGGVMRWAMVLMLSAGMALAHAGVKDPQVMARMHGMKSMKDASALLGDIVKGKQAFDAAAVAAAFQVLETEADQIVTLFEAQADDPKSEALPVIWAQFDDFSAKALAMQDALPMGDVAEDDLRDVFMRVTGTCKGCHETYRK
jgi:cytochrome c556